jgi:hypothetical protein
VEVVLTVISAPVEIAPITKTAKVRKNDRTRGKAGSWLRSQGLREKKEVDQPSG